MIPVIGTIFGLLLTFHRSYSSVLYMFWYSSMYLLYTNFNENYRTLSIYLWFQYTKMDFCLLKIQIFNSSTFLAPFEESKERKYNLTVSQNYKQTPTWCKSTFTSVQFQTWFQSSLTYMQTDHFTLKQVFN